MAGILTKAGEMRGKGGRSWTKIRKKRGNPSQLPASYILQEELRHFWIYCKALPLKVNWFKILKIPLLL